MRIKYNNLIAIVILYSKGIVCAYVCKVVNTIGLILQHVECRYSGHAFDLQFSTSFIFLQQSFNTVAAYGLITNVCAFICCNTLIHISRVYNTLFKFKLLKYETIYARSIQDIYLFHTLTVKTQITQTCYVCPIQGINLFI